jgi:hypothetical protein
MGTMLGMYDLAVRYQNSRDELYNTYGREMNGVKNSKKEFLDACVNNSKVADTQIWNFKKLPVIGDDVFDKRVFVRMRLKDLNSILDTGEQYIELKKLEAVYVKAMNELEQLPEYKSYESLKQKFQTEVIFTVSGGFTVMNLEDCLKSHDESVLKEPVLSKVRKWQEKREKCQCQEILGYYLRCN